MRPRRVSPAEVYESVAQAPEHEERTLRQKLKRGFRRGLARLWQHAYRIRHKASHYQARYGTVIRSATVVILIAASAYLLPALQTQLETWFATEEAVQRVQNLLLNTGSALIGAAAIVTSLVLFAMQVNVERLPHGLFHWFSQDRKLLGAFASAFMLATGVAATSTVVEQSRLAVVVVAAAWAILFILGLFLYAYRRALRLINPLEQLQILLDDTRKDLRRWARRAERATPLLESKEQAEAESSPMDPMPDSARTAFFQINAHWTAGAKRSVQHAMSFARRYAEQGDYEVVCGALNVVVRINAAYIEAKGKTFYSNSLFLDHPLASDGFINESLECMRQNVECAIRHRDERQIEQSMQALAALVQAYLDIDYANRTAEKSHAHLAAGYLTNAVQAVVPHDMADVLMEGQRLMGQAAQVFVVAGSTSNAAGLSDKIAIIACAGCAKGSYRPVTMEGVRQLANLTLYLLRSPSNEVSYALGKVRENASMIAKLFLKVSDTPLENIHGTMLAPYYSSGDMQSLRVQLTELVNAVAAAEPDNENAHTVIRNFEEWADGLYRTTKEVLLEAIAARSHFTIHMFQWIQGVTEILLVASNAPACDRHSKEGLRSHAGWLIATLGWVPEDQETVTFVETFQLTEILFEAAMDARSRGCDDNAGDIGRMLLSWAFKGGRYITGWGVLERGLCGCAALASTGDAGAVDALKTEIRRHLESDRAPQPEILAHGAAGLRRAADRAAGPRYASSRIDHAMARLDYRTLVPLLEEIAEMLSPPAQ